MGGTLAPTAPPAGIAGTGIAALQDAPAPPPESFKAYAKKSEEGNGVMAMIDLLVKDLDKEMTVATATEKDASYLRQLGARASRRRSSHCMRTSRSSAVRSEPTFAPLRPSSDSVAFRTAAGSRLVRGGCEQHQHYP